MILDNQENNEKSKGTPDADQFIIDSIATNTSTQFISSYATDALFFDFDSRRLSDKSSSHNSPL
ncbi:MAG: hypothetical protein F6K14_28950 [Symploca sp. SIO2C1]|nr:hypothetical protein [Symploca sp. SIO2C1]